MQSSCAELSAVSNREAGHIVRGFNDLSVSKLLGDKALVLDSF